jgi:DNA-binding MarR family transcriptional regulator
MVIARLLRKRYDQRARTMGMTLAQWRTIAAIRDNEGATQRRVAAIIEVGDVTAGRLIDRLQEQGWVERRPDPDDRRVFRLYLSPNADPLIDRLGRLGADEERCAFDGFTEEEKDQLGNLLARVIENLGSPSLQAQGAMD